MLADGTEFATVDQTLIICQKDIGNPNGFRIFSDVGHGRRASSTRAMASLGVLIRTGEAMIAIGLRAYVGGVFVALLATSRAFAAPYSVLDLGTLGGNDSQTPGYGTVNNLGQVVGDSGFGGTQYAFRTIPDGTINAASNLGTFGSRGSHAISINASGQVVGQSNTFGTDNDHAFRTAANGKIDAASDLGTLGGSGSSATGINASGQTVGVANIAGDVTSHAFRTAPNGKIDAASDLGTLGGYLSTAVGINAAGQVVGWSYISDNTSWHGFRTVANAKISAADDLGTLGGAYSEAFGVNALGQAVGMSSTNLSKNTPMHAFRTTATGSIDSTTDLGTLGGAYSRACAINILGQTVGFSYTAVLGPTHAFFADATGSMLDLNSVIPADSGWTLYDARGINDSGQIAGTGMTDGHIHAFLLTPNVPDPASASVFALGFMLLLRRRRIV